MVEECLGIGRSKAANGSEFVFIIIEVEKSSFSMSIMEISDWCLSKRWLDGGGSPLLSPPPRLSLPSLLAAAVACTGIFANSCKEIEGLFTE
jgi:hypothetical protein